MPDIIEASVPQSPGWWLNRLYASLLARRPIIAQAVDYYDGVHNLEYASKKFKETFGNLFTPFADNWCGVVADAVEERLNVTGFRVDATDIEGDSDAWDLWQRSQMDAQSQMAHQAAIVAGVAYAVPWIGDDGKAEITVESPVNTIIECHPKIRRRRRAGLRCWRDDAGFEHAELFLPDFVYQFRSITPRTSDDMMAGNVQWTVDPDATNVDTSGAMKNPLGVVPVVELLNNARLLTARSVGWAAHSEIRDVIPLQNAVNKLFADMIAASEANTLPTRYAEGYEQDVDPVTKQLKPPAFSRRTGAGEVWWLEDPSAKFGQFQPASLDGFVKAIDLTVQHIASISRTPPHYLNSSADRLSGESIKAAETGLVAKVKRKWRPLGEGWEEAVRLTGQIAGNERLASATRMETIWGDPESRTESEHVDAVSKKVAIGVPWRQAMEDLDYSEDQIQRMEAERAADGLLDRPDPEGLLPGIRTALPPTVPAAGKNAPPV